MATHADAAARIYARSLFELARDAGGPDKVVEVADELEQICELARSNQMLHEFLASPIIAKSARMESLKQIFANRLTDLTLRFLLVLNKKGRLRDLEAINSAFDALVQETFDRVEVDVYTPAPLGEQQLATIRQRIETALGKEPVLHPYTDAAMLGGIKLRIGDQLIDGSVASRLRRLKNSLMTDGTTSLRHRLTDIIEGGAS